MSKHSHFPIILGIILVLFSVQNQAQIHCSFQPEKEAFSSTGSRGVASVDTSTWLTIPVVFHVLHLGGPENIADSIIQKMLDFTNEDFSAKNPNLSQIIPQHQALIGNMKIKFVLANIDPQCNPTNGIDRIYTALTDSGGMQAMINPWDRSRFLNIWVMRKEPYAVSGFALTTNETRGISILSNSFANSYFNYQAILTHLIGHCLNLRHLCGACNGTCGDDLVDDTPVTKGGGSCDTIGKVDECPGVPNSYGNINPPGSISNFQNFMAFTSCPLMFTKGQVMRARTYLFDTANAMTKLFNQTPCVFNGIENLQNENYNVLVENPFFGTGNFQIQANESGMGSFLIADQMGAVLENKANFQIHSGANYFEFGKNLPSAGVYFLKVEINGKTTVRKIVKL